MGDNLPKKQQSFFEKLRAAMPTLRRPTTVPKQADTLPVYSLTITTGSASFVVPAVDNTNVNLYGESSRTTPTTTGSVATHGESKKTKRSKQAKSKKHEKQMHKNRDHSEESTPESQQTESLAVPHAAIPAVQVTQDDTNPTDMSETAESDNYSTANSTQSKVSVLYNRKNASRNIRRQKQTDLWGNTANECHGNTHAHGKISSPVNHNHNKGQGKSTSQKIKKIMPKADGSGLPSVEDHAEETVSRPGTSHSALVKIFVSNPLTETDCASVPIYLELPEPEQSTAETPTVGVAMVTGSHQNTCFNNKTPTSGTKHENSTKTFKDNKKCLSPKGHTFFRGTTNKSTARALLQPTTPHRSTKPLLQSKKTEKIVKPPLPTANKVIFHKISPHVTSIPESKQRDSTDRPKTTDCQTPHKSKTENQPSGNTVDSSQRTTMSNNQDSGGHKNNALNRSNLQVRPQTYHGSRNSRTEDTGPSKRDVVSSTDRSRNNVSNRCNSPQTTQSSRNSRTQTVSPTNRLRSNVSNKCNSQLRPQTSQDSRNLRSQETSQLIPDNTISSASRPRSNASNKCTSPLRTHTSQCSSNSRAYLTPQSKLNKSTLPKDVTSSGQSGSNNVTDRCESQVRPQQARCSSNSRAYLASQSKLKKTISPTSRSRSSTSDRHNSQLQSGTTRASNRSRAYLPSQSQLKKNISPMNQSRSNASASCNSPLQPETSRASTNTRAYLQSQSKLHKTISLTDRSKSNNESDGCDSQLRPHTARDSSNSRAFLSSQSELDPTISPTVRRPNTTPEKVLNKSQFKLGLKSNSSILISTITNILPPGINEQESSRRVADTLENCPASSTITVPSELCRLKNGRHISPRETQGISNFQLFNGPSTSQGCSNTEVNTSSRLLLPNIRQTTSFPFTKADKFRRTPQDLNPPSDVKMITVPLIREKTYLILPSPKVSGINDDANKAMLPKHKSPLLTRQNTFLILPTQENGSPTSKRKSLNTLSSSTPVIKRKRSRGQLSKIVSDNLVTNTSSAIPLAKGNTYLIMPGTTASRNEVHEDSLVIPLMKKSTYLVLSSKKRSSEIKIHRSCGNIPLIRSSTYEIIKSKRIFSVP